MEGKGKPGAPLRVRRWGECVNYSGFAARRGLRALPRAIRHAAALVSFGECFSAAFSFQVKTAGNQNGLNR